LGAIANGLPAYQAELHLANLNPDQIEVDFAMNTVLQVEFAILKFELYVQTIFNAHLHLDGRVLDWLILQILDDKFFLFRHFGILAINRHVDVVANAHHDPIVRLELLLRLLELKWIALIISQSAWGVQVSNELQERRRLLAVN